VSTPLLIGFSQAVVARLVDDGRLVLAKGASPADVAAFLAEALATRPALSGLVSSVSNALIACPLVDELFAEDAALQELFNELGMS
jgi:hypothetical protein